MKSNTISIIWLYILVVVIISSIGIIFNLWLRYGKCKDDVAENTENSDEKEYNISILKDALKEVLKNHCRRFVILDNFNNVTPGGTEVEEMELEFDTKTECEDNGYTWIEWPEQYKALLFSIIEGKAQDMLLDGTLLNAVKGDNGDATFDAQTLTAVETVLEEFMRTASISVGMDACSNSPCRKGGTCIPSSSTCDDDVCPPSFTCDCLEGTSGTYCEIGEPLKLQACNPNPCRNGGTCISAEGEESRFSCICPSGWQGLTCDLDEDAPWRET